MKYIYLYIHIYTHREYVVEMRLYTEKRTTDS